MVLSLRATTVLVLLVGAGMGWYAHESRVQRRAVEKIKAAGGFVYYDWQWDRSTGEIDYNHATPPEPAWVARRVPVDLMHSVASVWYSSDRAPDPTFASIAQLDRLEELRLSLSGVTDGVLHDLGSLRPRRLTHLAVGGTGITRAGLAALHSLPSLKELSLTAEPSIKDDDLAVLQTLPHLRSLRLDSMPISDRGLADIARLKRLDKLHLGYSEPHGAITDAGLRQLARLSELKELALSSHPVSDDTFRLLSRSLKLETLYLAQTGLSDVRVLCGLEGLKHLDIEDPLDDAAIHAIDRLPELETLELYNSEISDAGVQRICRLGNLVKLTICSDHVTDASVGALSSLKRCRYLRIAWTKISKAGARRLQRALPGCKVDTDTGEY